ncbi:metallophosphoesterase [Saccharopolyspora pogona]|uniref:metallophosphoesterase n=1 Tax=Saccharopolyspora pogona TaxID=333966 RepID=UPI0016836E4B|nr:metallophosphoesterase [Saccharopolyspora pogona]
MSKSYVVISDTQCPYEDKKAMAAVIRFIGEYQPDEVVHIGDVVDFPQPSRWNKDTKGEFEGSVFKDVEYTVKNLIAPLRAIYGGDIGFLEGNHDLRPREYLAKYAPALAESHAFDMDVLLNYEEYEIRKLPDFYNFAPGWLMTHGHLGKIPLTQNAGATALGAAKKFSSSVIMGHTHRLGIGHFSTGYGGAVSQTLTGMEVGNLMDMKQAGYLKGGAANWQQGFGLVHVDGKHVQATPIRISGRRFVVDGVTYNV